MPSFNKKDIEVEYAKRMAIFEKDEKVEEDTSFTQEHLRQFKKAFTLADEENGAEQRRDVDCRL